MNTDDLIKILAQSPRAPQKLQIGAWGIALVALATLATQVMLGLRPEVLAFAPSPSLLVKLAVIGLLALTAVLDLKEQSVPVAAARCARPVGIVTALLLVGLVAHEWLTVDSAQIKAFFYLRNFPACLLFVALYGVMGAIALTVHMQASAPADTRRAASAIGFAAAATGAVGYAMHCPIDSPTFIAVAYGIPLFFITLAARLILPRFLKW